MSDLLNISVLRNPANWFVVLVSVVLALFALHYSLALIHGAPVPAGKHPSKVS